MYEHQTFEAILSRMLARIPADMDKREGSVIYDALAPAAAELAQVYVELDVNDNLSYADTATGEFLQRRTAEFGVDRLPATKARRKGLFRDKNGLATDVPIGSRFSISNLTFAVITKTAPGEFTLECETTGVVGNQHFGALLPLEYIDGLASAELADVLAPGAEAESDDDLRARHFEYGREKPFGGNRADYKNKVGTLSGVGGVKVFRAWAGGGTVKCTIIASDFTAPTAALVSDVQTAVDPTVNAGEGLGLAPIDHVVTIASVAAVNIAVSTTLTLSAGVTASAVQADIEAAIEEYLLTLRKAWKDEERLIVRVSQIEARILAVKGVEDVANTTLNGAAVNVELGSEEIPVLGVVTLVV